jgi:hypothetical protein
VYDLYQHWLKQTYRIARLLVAMSSGNEGALAQRNPLEIMLELVKKYSSFAYTQKAHVYGTNGNASNSVTPRVVSPLLYFPKFHF